MNPLTPKAQETCFPFGHAKIRQFLPAFLILSFAAANPSSALAAALGSALQISFVFCPASLLGAPTDARELSARRGSARELQR